MTEILLSVPSKYYVGFRVLAGTFKNVAYVSFL